MEDWWVWCGSAIRGDDGRYHLFASRWSRQLPMLVGYIFTSEIVRAVADRPEGPYTFVEKVLPSGNPDAWDGRMAHNPCILRCGDTFLLYYIGTTFAGEIDRSQFPDYEKHGPWRGQCSEVYSGIRIGLATAPSVEGPWTTRPAPILDVRPGRWDSYVVTNPAPCLGPDGRILLFYRSSTPDGLRIGLAGADHFDGPYTRLSDDPVLRLPGDQNVEDPFAWWNGEHYEMFAKDMTGGITGEKHAGAHFRSRDGLTWTPLDPPKAYSRTVTFDTGETVTLGCLERPQLFRDENGKPRCLFAAAADGPGGFENATRTWNIAIPVKS